MAKTGRPSKYDNIDMDQVQKLVEYGHDDKFCASFFGVTEQTWNNWKQTHPEFFESIKSWKQVADERVERALYERAVGYSHEETKVFGDGLAVPVIKHYPPDPVSMIFWLKNRMPEQWRDKQNIDLTSKGDKLAQPQIVAYDEQTRELIEQTIRRKRDAVENDKRL